MYILIPLREKYRNPGFMVDRTGGRYVLLPKYAYRTRTGPHCCNSNCPSGRKKSLKTVKRVIKIGL